ncbi:MAG: acetate kinase [Lachnospiraceae bacterium]|nr:acetate kinase [Lachnospiraceae bacterium]
MKILVINCGSSSLKYQVIDSDTEHVLAKGLCERIGIDGRLTYQPAGKDKIKYDAPMPAHRQAVELVLKQLTDPDTGILKSVDEIQAVGHRMVHGGEKFACSTLLTDEVLATVESCNDLAPLHNPPTLVGVAACKELMPTTPMVGVFDTAFHQTMAPEAYIYGLPYEYYKKYGMRRYGFHGTSHKFVSQRTAELLGKKPEDVKVIVCHLGNGSSISAIDGGKCVETSMGLTPLEGLIMGTRSGDIDPTCIEFIAHKENITLEDAMTIINKKSGVLGISGVSSDFRDLEDAANEGNERAKLALDAFCHHVKKYIGSYIAVMNGVDAIVFTAGIGENSPEVREQIMEGFGYIGAHIDPVANKVRGKETLISTPDSKVKVFCVPTNEELAICRDTVEIVTKKIVEDTVKEVMNK